VGAVVARQIGIQRVCGGKSYNPMVLVFRPFRRPRVFRFFGPFKAWKQGNPGQVERMRQDLFNAL
jgi:hypothetical protein